MTKPKRENRRKPTASSSGPVPPNGAKCPRCDGRGWFGYGSGRITCHDCNGKGFIIAPSAEGAPSAEPVGSASRRVLKDTADEKATPEKVEWICKCGGEVYWRKSPASRYNGGPYACEKCGQHFRKKPAPQTAPKEPDINTDYWCLDSKRCAIIHRLEKEIIALEQKVKDLEAVTKTMNDRDHLLVNEITDLGAELKKKDERIKNLMSMDDEDAPTEKPPVTAKDDDGKPITSHHDCVSYRALESGGWTCKDETGCHYKPKEADK